MKLTELKLTEEVGGKNKKLFDENEEISSTFVKKQTFDIRKSKDNERVHVTMKGQKRATKTAKVGDYFIRLHDDIEQVDLISEDDFKKNYQPLQQGAEEDAEGFITYRETGEYEAFQYTGDEIYIYTDWNTKQRLKTGDYLVRPMSSETASGFVVPAAEFAKHFEEVK